MKPVPETLQLPANSNDPAPVLDACTRAQLGRQLQKVYAPVLEQKLDPRLAKLLLRLEKDQKETQGS